MNSVPAVASLVELIQRQGRDAPDEVAYTFHGEPRPYLSLADDVNRFALALIADGFEPGEPAVLAIPNGHEFFTAFYGVQAAGGIAVPVFPGLDAGGLATYKRLCGATLILTAPDVGPILAAGGAGTVRHPEADDIAVLQYTSGSTGSPKGVILRHRNLLKNVDQIITGMEITSADVFVSWLPTYHDMGLIIKTIVPFALRAELEMLPAAIRDTRPWLRAITERRGTFTAAPDFAYRLAVRQHTDPTGFDLTSLRVALNGAEPVRATTIAAFEERFGLGPTVVAGYGLAEATVGVSMASPGSRPVVDEAGRVAAGRPFPDIVVTVTDEDDQPLPTGAIGALGVQSPANTTGYYDNDEATAALFLDEATIRTGDLGYLDSEGQVFIAGRAKDVVITAGRSVHAEEAEEVVNAAAGVRYSAAIGCDWGDVAGEQVVIIAEASETVISDRDRAEATVVEIVQRFHGRFGFRPGRVHLAVPKTIPMTHNGKLRRHELRSRYESGALAAGLAFP